MALSLILNPAHRRIKRPRLGLFAQGQYPAEGGGFVSGWSRQLLENVWQEPVRGNLTLLPVCLADEFAWANTFTGEYARLTFGDFGLAEGVDGWRRGGLNPARLARDEGMTAAAITTATFGGDRGVYASWFTFDRGVSDGIDMELGFGASGSATDPAYKLALQFLAGGSVNVNRGGETVGQGSIGARQKDFQEVLVIPMNAREVLVLSLTNNAGFIQAFDDVEESDPWPRIVPDVPLWFYRPSGAVDVEIAPLRFKTSGHALSTKQAYAEKPSATVGGSVTEPPETFARADAPGTSATTSVTKLDGSPYDPSSEDLGARLKVALSGDGSYTPFVHAAVAGYEAVTADTDGSATVELPERAMRVSLEAPESPCDVRAGFSALGRELGVDDALWDLERLTSDPLDLVLDDLAPFFSGQSGPTPSRPAPTAKADYRGGFVPR